MTKKRLSLLILLLAISLLIVPRGTLAGGCHEYKTFDWVTDSLDLGTTTQTFYVNTDYWNTYGYRPSTASVTLAIDSVARATTRNVATLDSVKLEIYTVSNWGVEWVLSPTLTADVNTDNTVMTVIATGAISWGVPTAWYDLKYLMEQELLLI